MVKLILNFKSKESKKIKNLKKFLGSKGANLAEMSKAELQGLCKKVGINPFYEKDIIIGNILKEFRRLHSGSIFTAPQSIPTPELDPENPKHKEILDWLNS